jgi:ABC-type multidrug transport system fused ATPase/permease subunit
VSTCSIYQRYLEINKQFQQALDKHEQESKANEIVKQGTADLDTLLESLPLLRPLSLRNSRASRKTRDSAILRADDALEEEEVLKKLIIPEDREKGAVSFKTYGTFFRELGGYLPNLFGFLLCLSVEAVMTTNFARLSTWSEKFGELDRNKELNQYMLFSLSGAGLSFMRTMLYGCLSYFLSRKIHSKMIFGILHSRMEEFLSRVPAGRIINRFSKDIQEIDQSLIYNVSYFFTVTAELLIYILAFGYLLGYEVVISIVCMMIICLYYQRIYMNARREFIRLDAISKSPILTTVIDTMRGLTNIRNSDKQSYFRKKFLDRCDDSLKNTYIRNAMNEWYSVRTGIITSLFVLVPSYLNIMYGSKDVSLATAVFTIVINSSLSYSLKEVLTQYSRLEASMIAVERCHHFEKIEPEPQYKSYKKDFELVDGSKSSIEKLKKRQIENTEQIVTEGSIEFKDMSCKYATSQNPILSKLSFTIKPREKIGVIGRTGSGKSTLIKLLWRALDFYEGDIKVDGKSIKDVDLKSLRSQIMIVTQETALIEGTLRENIDIRLEDKSRDAEITAILTKLGFANPNYQKDGLDMAIDGEGSNLSAGEKQLISFARTLLDKKKIMILDEATANIDLKTEEKIQACVEQDFKDTTMLIIAHRIQTIMNCDRILILEKGKMAALDTPANLSNQKDSYFNNIINKMKEKKN